MLADLRALRVDHEAALAIAQAVLALLHALADGDVLEPHAVDEVDDLLLLRRRRVVGEIPFDLLDGLLGTDGDVMEDSQIAARIDLDAPVGPEQPAAELVLLRGLVGLGAVALVRSLVAAAVGM